jgi:hypothetical protein
MYRKMQRHKGFHTLVYVENMLLLELQVLLVNVIENVFYKRQLWVYNFCITSGRPVESYFFLYDEATGRKGQNEVISFLYHYFS